MVNSFPLGLPKCFDSDRTTWVMLRTPLQHVNGIRYGVVTFP